MSKYNRKVKLAWSPQVTIRERQVVVTSGGQQGATRYECTGELSCYCAEQLILELRKALRKIRDDETARLNGCVSRAEAALP